MYYGLPEANAQVGQANTTGNSKVVSGVTQGQIYNKPPKPSGLIGTPYPNDSWLLGDVWLNEGLPIMGKSIKYDLSENQLIFKIDERLFFLKHHKIDSFRTKDSPDGEYASYVLSGLWSKNRKEDVGVYQKLTYFEGYVLLRKNTLDIIPGNYNTALMIGEKESRYQIKTEYFILNMKENELTTMPNSKKTLAEYFEAKEMNEYIKLSKPKLKNEGDLIELINYANTITKGLAK